jgi:hypothetical protein
MKKYKFKATIQPGIGGGAASFSLRRRRGVRHQGQVPVKSTPRWSALPGSLVKCGPTSHMLGVLKGIREQIGKGPGDTIEVVLWKDEAERTVEVPAELAER